MTQSVFKHVKISGISTIVPKKEICLEDEAEYYNNDMKKIARTRKIVGLYKRRVVEGNISASDLCTQAAEQLFEDMHIDVSTVDALIFVVQNPDYSCPASACIIHNNLKLSVTCPAFDINQGCAGYTYGLWVASSLIEGGGCKKVLLCAGDTFSIHNFAGNRITAPVFGDAGSATLLEYSEKENLSYYELGADGAGAENIIIPAGGVKIPFVYDAEKNQDLIRPMHKDGNVSHLCDLYMDGMAVFNFTMSVVPPHINSLMEFANIEVADVDYLVLHQANRQIIRMIGDTVGFPEEKVPSHTVECFGNQTIASIPSAICDVLKNEVSNGRKNLVLSGFGIGLAWASCSLNLDNIYCSGIVDFIQDGKSESREQLIEKWKNKLEGQNNE